jgi:hypothetical protein
MTRFCKSAALALWFSAFISAYAASTPPKVVFIGDQFTYNWGTTPGAFPSNWINKGWNKAAYTSDPNCFVTCEGGTSGSTAERFQTDVINLHPDIVHIMVGADDADANDDASVPYIYPGFLSSVASMIQTAKAANIQVILGIESNEWSSEGGAYFEQMNSMVATLGAQNNIPVINYGNALCSCVQSTGGVGIGQNFATQQAYMDQITGAPAYQPTAAGYALMTRMAAAVINTMGHRLTGGYLQTVQQESERVGADQPIINGNTVSTQGLLQFTPYGIYSGLAAAQPMLNANYAGATGTWASSNPLVMYVSQTGLAWALTPGTAAITYTSPGGVRFHEWIMYVQ